MAAAKFGAAAVGVVILLLGVVAALGYVPGLSVTCVSNCNQGVTVNFQYQQQGTSLTVKLVDLSYGGTTTILSDNINWGDGTPSANSTSLNQVFTHTYSAAGTYQVTDTITVITQGLVPQVLQVVGVGPVVVTSSGGGGCGSSCVVASVAPAFSYTTNGFSAVVTDTSVATGAPTITSVRINWGDLQTSSPVTALGSSFSHTYSSVGTYTVTDTVSWTSGPSNTPYTASAKQSITVTAGGSSGGGCNGNGNGPPFPPGCPVHAPPATANFNLLTGFLISFGAMLAILPLVPVMVVARVGLGTVVVIVFSLVAWFSGGTGPV